MNEKQSTSFVGVCTYEVKPEKVDEFEEIIERVAKHHRDFPCVKDVRYIKRTHRQKDFASVKVGEPRIKLSRKPKSITYVLYWELDNEIVHEKATKSGLEHFFKEFTRCLITTPKIILGEQIQ